MTAKTRIDEFLAGMFVLAVAALFVISFANSVVAEGIVTYSGEVVAIDSGSRMLTVRAGGSPETMGTWLKGELSFTVDDNTTLMSCNEIKNFEDIRAGDAVTVTYYEKEGKPFADFVSFASSPEMLGAEKC
jgi:hypothetical protein